MIEKAITENTAALLELAASNRELAAAYKGGQPVNVNNKTEKVVEVTTKDKPESEPKETEEDKKPAKAEEKEETTSEVTADDLRKVAGVLVENDNNAGFKKVLKAFETKNITAFDKEDGDLAAMLAALEEEAGVKLEDIAD